MSVVMRIRCSECLFWQITKTPDTGDTGLGQCRRHPPTLEVARTAKVYNTLNGDHQGDTIGLSTRWPVTNGGDWCGEAVDATNLR